QRQRQLIAAETGDLIVGVEEKLVGETLRQVAESQPDPAGVEIQDGNSVGEMVRRTNDLVVTVKTGGIQLRNRPRRLQAFGRAIDVAIRLIGEGQPAVDGSFVSIQRNEERPLIRSGDPGRLRDRSSVSQLTLETDFAVGSHGDCAKPVSARL